MNPRLLLAAGVVVAAIVLGVVVLPSVGGSGERAKPGDGAATVVRAKPDVRAPLTLERYQQPDTGDHELLVSSPGPRYNRVDMVRGSPTVWLTCFDRTGAQAIRTRHDWPLQEEPGFPPHIHQPAGSRLLESIRRCRLTGAGIDFEGKASGRLPVAR